MSNTESGRSDCGQCGVSWLCRARDGSEVEGSRKGCVLDKGLLMLLLLLLLAMVAMAAATLVRFGRVGV